MKKVLHLVKTNLPGIAVAVGVCTFSYEALIKHDYSFTLTKYIGVLIGFVVVYYKYNDKPIDQKPVSKSKYEINRAILTGYLKKRLNDAPLQIAIFLLLYFWNKGYAYEYIVLLTIGFVEGFFTYVKKQRYIAELEKKGLTENDVTRAAFIKKWEENRERGLVKYCIIDGGIITGALLSVGIGLIGMFTLNDSNKRMFADGPGEMFQFIGITYVIGAAIGIVAYRLTWYVNEKKFNKLTGALH
jgi:hypothetical protein